MHWRSKWQPTPVLLPGESQGWRSLVGCCLWGRTESDTTEQLNWTELNLSPRKEEKEILKHSVLITQSCDSMDSSSPGSSVRGILQARILEWVTISSPIGVSEHQMSFGFIVSDGGRWSSWSSSWLFLKLVMMWVKFYLAAEESDLIGRTVWNFSLSSFILQMAYDRFLWP